jgi:DNA recombination protein RmuC
MVLLIVVMVMVGVLLVIVMKSLLDRKGTKRIEDAVRGLGLEQKIGEIKSYNDGIKEQYLRLQTEMEHNVGQIMQYASDVRTDYRSLDTMLRVPQQRGALGEIALETILADQLPESMYGIRQRVFGKNPDAHINSVVGIICVDSKFPLDNFKKMIDAESDDDKASYKAEFLKNIRVHLQKIKDDYVRPDLGTTEFAFAFIPSESVYWFLVTEMYDELMKWTKDGVIVVSPLTISSKIALIRSGVHAKKLSDEASKIMEMLTKLKNAFVTVDASWKTFFSSHFTNAYKKAQAVDEAYRKLRDTFDGIQAE